ncbi:MULTISPECIES: hypothetical protein [unclassified Arthrobacter]|uniref:hypothetical protein n=1 Tax=unclassified Arthrobacter TaxID=235627 RepID=UPI001D477FAC|nr:hypothetical protein [Arthrobacter sp. Bi26]CAH0257364.1 hypothetical protein SRABI26_03302 [Arthrobacter sp. Bi26]
MSPQPERLPEGPQPDGPQPEESRPEETLEPRPVRPDRTLLAILVAIAVLVMVALTVVLTRGEPAPLAESTPAGVAQRYAAAAIAGDEAAAAAYLTPAARNKCSAEARPVARNLRVTLVSTTERPESADVRVLITVSEPGGPFGSAEYQVEDVFDLVRSGNGWLIDTAPWQLSVCPGQVKR